MDNMLLVPCPSASKTDSIFHMIIFWKIPRAMASVARRKATLFKSVSVEERNFLFGMEFLMTDPA
jgi:hypothetical protein